MTWASITTNSMFAQWKKFMAVRYSSSLPNTPDSSATPKPSGAQEGPGIRKTAALTSLQKWALVFSGKYKSQADIPKHVPIEVVERASSRARIRVSNYLMILTLMGCLAYAYSGRKAAERGESVSQINLDWHKEYSEKLRQEKEEASKK